MGCKRIFIVLVILLLAGKVYGQYNPLDTFKIYLAKKPVFYLSLDGRNSFVRDRPATIDGLRFGLSYGNKIRLLVGLYDLRRPIYRNYIYKQGSTEEEFRSQRSDFFYVSFTCDYVAYRTKRWKLAIPLQTGYGWGNRKEFSPSGELRVDRDITFIPWELSLSATYNIFDWLSAGVGIGYRYALFSNTISGDFSAPIYTYGFSVDPFVIYERYLKVYVEK